MDEQSQKELDDRLFSAIADNAWERVEAAVKEGADVNGRDELGHTPLLCTMYHGGSGPTIRLLLEKGAEVNYDSTIALHVACGYQPRAVVGLLLDAGADVNARGKLGYTALHRAVLGSNYDTARFLLERGADANAKSEHGENPLDLLPRPPDAQDLEHAGLEKDREHLLDWYREHHPELVFERFCTGGPQL